MPLRFYFELLDKILAFAPVFFNKQNYVLNNQNKKNN